MQKDGNDVQTQEYVAILKDTLSCIQIMNNRNQDSEKFSERAGLVTKRFCKIKDEKLIEDFVHFLREVIGDTSQEWMELLTVLHYITGDQWFYGCKIETFLRRELERKGNFYLILQLKKQLEIADFFSNIHRNFMEKWDINQYFQKEMPQLLDMNYNKIPVKERRKDFIVIVTTQLLGVSHSPTKMVLEFCRIFEKYLKVKVLLVCALESVHIEKIEKLGIKVINGVNCLDRQGSFMMQYKESEIECYQIFLDEENMEEQRELIQSIYEKKPLFVWQFAGIPAFASTMRQCTSYYYMQMTQGYPAVSADLVINYFQDTLKHYPDEYRILQEKGIPVADMFFTFSRCSSKGLLSRDQFQIPEDGFCLGVAGNRLASECTEEFLQILTQVLKKEKQMMLVFIGTVDQKFIERIHRIIHAEDRCFFLGQQSNPEEALALIDLYVDMPHQGGGYMGTSAISEGKPVLCLKGGDVSAKVGIEFCYDSLEEYENEILRYKNDTVYYKMKSEAARKRADSIMVNDEELAELVSRTVKLGLKET